MTGNVQTIRVMIVGDVQGVWFRKWTVKTARSLDLGSWVRNRQNGAVEAVFSGSNSDVKIMLERCHDGPSAARIDSVTVVAWDDRAEFEFRQLPTA